MEYGIVWFWTTHSSVEFHPLGLYYHTLLQKPGEKSLNITEVFKYDFLKLAFLYFLSGYI